MEMRREREEYEEIEGERGREVCVCMYVCEVLCVCVK